MINIIAPVSDQLVYIAKPMLVQTYILCGVMRTYAMTVCGSTHSVVLQIYDSSILVTCFQ